MNMKHERKEERMIDDDREVYIVYGPNEFHLNVKCALFVKNIGRLSVIVISDVFMQKEIKSHYKIHINENIDKIKRLNQS